MTGKKFTDSVSSKPRVRVDENGVIDIAGLMHEMITQEAVAEHRDSNTDDRPTDKPDPTEEPNVPD